MTEQPIEIIKDYIAVNKGKMSLLYFCKKHKVSYKKFAPLAYAVAVDVEADLATAKKESTEWFNKACALQNEIGNKAKRIAKLEKILVGTRKIICDYQEIINRQEECYKEMETQTKRIAELEGAMDDIIAIQPLVCDGKHQGDYACDLHIEIAKKTKKTKKGSD